MVDESWFYLTSDAITVLLIEDMDVLIRPKVQHKSHIETELSGSRGCKITGAHIFNSEWRK